MKNRELRISDYLISDESKPFVIAEIGANHQGRVDLCETMFELAARSGADAVKLQKRENRLLFMPSLFNQPYIGPTSFAPTYGLHREFLEFNLDQYKHLQKFADNLGLIFFATATDKKSVDFLVDINVPAIKIASADLYSTPLIKYASKFGIPLIMSTGGSDQSTVDRAMDFVDPSNIGLLQCTATYPAEAEEMNLNVITTFRDRYPETVIGLSSHDRGISFPIIAAALGARIIEKHFTLDRSLPGPDQLASLEPLELKAMVSSIRNIELAISGNGMKEPSSSELKNMEIARKSIVAKTAINKGDIFSESNITTKRPGNGISPMQWDEVIGQVAQANFNEDDLIKLVQ